MNKKTLLFFVILGLLITAVSTSGLMDVVLTSPDNTSTHDRRPDFVYTATTDNATTAYCNLTIGATTQPTNALVTNNTAFTQNALTLADGEYAWNVSCMSTGDGVNHTNTSATWFLNVSFATYTGSDAPAVTIDILIGVLSAIFGLVTLVVLILLLRWMKGSKGKLLVIK